MISKNKSCPILIMLLIWIMIQAPARAESFSRKQPMHDSVILMDPSGTTVYSLNPETLRPPASTLKVLTSLAALKLLGDDFAFKTSFHMANDGTLIIKGYGDPLLISETISESAAHLAGILKHNKITACQIAIDDSYFETPVIIPGVTKESTQPYDAPNGALCANFNTVFFKKSPKGEFISAEPQTPLLPYLMKRVRQSGVSSGRIKLTAKESSLYAGYLYKYFLEKAGVKCPGNVTIKTVTAWDKPLWTFSSKTKLPEVIQSMLKYSNNYMANQLLITIGIKTYGSPGNLEKGVRALKMFSKENLGIDDMELVEGSGISRQNRVSAKQMAAVLGNFEKYRHLLKNDNWDFYKTGTLNGIRTRVGWIESEKGEYYKYCVMTDSKKDKITSILKDLRKRADNK